MDFDSILKQWERKGSRGKDDRPENGGRENERPGSDEVAGTNTDWLDLFPPNSEVLGTKNADDRPPVSQGRSIWLRRPPQDTLDLHGLNGREAKRELARFIRSMRRRGLRKGLVIHGKGLHSAEGSVLGPLVREYLESSVDIGEFGRATRKEGGSGATWFVLRQRSL